ncbi:hypothetical protein GQ600_10784 [Phytophthora cactorum]|nr:hypothetical protein GQ600_10784 [Phytophthora cactorum]
MQRCTMCFTTSQLLLRATLLLCNVNLVSTDSRISASQEQFQSDTGPLELSLYFVHDKEHEGQWGS